jgi:hypothetical protein
VPAVAAVEGTFTHDETRYSGYTFSAGLGTVRISIDISKVS